MSGVLGAPKRNIQSKPKVKTGCGTCRIRKVKCDENKPSCQKCVNTGRTCGYESLFRTFTAQSFQNTHVSDIKSNLGLYSIRPALIEITLQDINLLNRYFSIKTLFNVKLGCNEEARQVLLASLTDLPVRNALSSLRALREDLETSGDWPAAVAQQNPSYYYGIQQYNTALGGLASNLSSPSSNMVRSALLCCQIFICIEQVRKDYAAMAQHIIRGLMIMHEYRARPVFVAADMLMPANHDQLPFLDVFIIKLSAAPCKFADPPVTVDIGRTRLLGCSTWAHPLPVEFRDLRTIAPNMRTELTKIAERTLELLAKVSQVESVEIALRLLSEKSALLDSLESWLIALEVVLIEIGLQGSEPLSVSFLRLFHIILKIVLLGVLDSSPNLHLELQTENDQLQSIASYIGERLRTYRRCKGTSGGREGLKPLSNQA